MERKVLSKAVRHLLLFKMLEGLVIFISLVYLFLTKEVSLDVFKYLSYGLVILTMGTPVLLYLRVISNKNNHKVLILANILLGIILPSAIVGWTIYKNKNYFDYLSQ